MTITASSGPSVEILMKIEGIQGDVTESGHKGDIALQSFSIGFTNPSPLHARGGAGAGRVTLESFHFVKSIDAASGKLLQDVASGKHLNKVEVEIFKRAPDGKLERTADYKLDDVILADIHHSAGHKATEAVTGDFAKLVFQGASGTSSGTVGSGKSGDKVTASTFSLRRH